MKRKTWKLYHGTGSDLVPKIMKEGLKPTHAGRVFLTTNKKYAMEHSRISKGYRSADDIKRRSGKVLEVTLKDTDFKGKMGSIRRSNLEQAFKEGYEYEYYYTIPPKRLKIL